MADLTPSVPGWGHFSACSLEMAFPFQLAISTAEDKKGSVF